MIRSSRGYRKFPLQLLGIALLLFCFFAPVQAAQPPCLDGYVLHSQDQTVIGNRSAIASGKSGSNGNFELGVEATSQEGLTARGNIVLHNRSQVFGSVAAGGTLKLGKGFQVAGTLSEGATILPCILNEETFSVGTQGIQVDPGHSRTLDPGAYGDVLVAKDGRLVLPSGTYTFKSLRTGPDVRMELNPSGGPIEIFIQDSLVLAPRTHLVFTGSPAPEVIKFHSQQTVPLMVGPEVIFQGTLVAPRAEVTLSPRVDWVGAAYGRRLHLMPDVKIRYAAFSTGPKEVSITHPEAGFLTNQSTITVTWTVDGVPQTTQISEDLAAEGPNIVKRCSQGVCDSILVIRDQTAPVVRILNPVGGTVARLATVPVIWTVDGVEQLEQISEDLPTEGENTITRSATDAAGNTGTASVTLIRDTQGLYPQAFATASPTNGPAPLPVQFRGTGSSTTSHIQYHKWDMDGDGLFEKTLAVPLDTLRLQQFDFETGLEGWVSDSVSGNISLAHGGPRSEEKPPNLLWSTNQAEEYIDGMDAWILSPPIELPAASACSLYFRQFFHSEEGFDFGFAEIDLGGGNFQILSSYTGILGSSMQALDLTPFAGTTLRLRFRFYSDFSIVATGWKVDDIKVVAYPDGVLAQPIYVDAGDDAGQWERNSDGAQWSLILEENQRVVGIGNYWIETDTASYTYRNDMDCWITSPTLSLPSDGNILLTYWQHLVTRDFGDGGVLEVSANQGPFVVVEPLGGYPGTITGHGRGFSGNLGTALPIFNLTAFAGMDIRLRFHFYSDGSGTDRGWLIDSVRVYQPVGLLDGISKFTYTYAEPGTYPVGFAVVDGEGRETRADTRILTIVAGPPGSPSVAILEPRNAMLTNQVIIPVFWSVNGVGQSTQVTETLQKEGENYISRSFTDASGYTVTATVSVILDTRPPVIEILRPLPGEVYTFPFYEVEYLVDGVLNREFRHLDPGVNHLVITAQDAAGNYAQASVDVIFSVDLPEVVITSPSDGATVTESPIRVDYTVDGEPFYQFFDLILGENMVRVEANNEMGYEGSDTIHLTLAPTPPTWSTDSHLTVSDIRASTLTLQWTEAQDDSAVSKYRIYRNNVLLATVPANPRTYYAAGLLLGTSYTFRVEALDLRGSLSQGGPQATAVTTTQLPPNPETVAPELPAGASTTLATAISFLYTGSDPIQTGVAPGALEPVRLSVLRGTVRDRTGSPLSGVTVSLQDRSEVGSTVTRIDGGYDLVVNGGGPLVVSFAAKAYLPVQRNIAPHWQEFEVLPDVVLTSLDTLVSQVLLLPDQPMQVVQASSVSDEAGTRQATLLVPSNTFASLILPDGNTQVLSAMHFRATEYTVGPSGPEAMPGTLPPTSFYTYAVEFTADEAMEAEAIQVKFTKPIWNYLENFRQIPVGYRIPVGTYDKKAGRWVPAEDGRVVQIAGITGGRADLVVDTTLAIASPEVLAALGITDEERQKLAGLYAPGQSLWRVPVLHFSSADYNFPVDLPPDYVWPKAKGSGSDEPTSVSNCQTGSIIDCQNQALGESVQFPGMPSLNYRSDRVPAKRWNTLKIPVTGPTVPASLARVRLDISIGGRKFGFLYPIAPNMVKTFEWDGKDAYGRVLRGKQPYSYTIAFGYKVSYQPPPDMPSPGSFGGGSGNLDFGPRTFGSTSGESFPVPVPAPLIYELSDTYTGYLGSVEVNDLGPGWSLESHHAYDPTSGVLHLGNGQNQSVVTGLGAIYTVAGGAEGVEDGIPAIKARLGAINGMDIGPDGALYLADRHFGYISKVDPNGIITTLATGLPWFDVDAAPDGNAYLTDFFQSQIWKLTADKQLFPVAGNGVSGFSGDGGPATQASLHNPNNSVLGGDGNLYIADRGNSRVRRVTPDGIIQSVAGTGNPIFNGDGNPASQTNMSVNHIDIGADGSIYIADVTNGRIRRVDPSGRVSTVAGNGESGNAGDGGPALEAQVVADRIKVVNTKGGGTLIYISDELNNTIRVVDEQGTINRIAGGGANQSKDGIPATYANITEPRGLAVDPEGNVYVGISSFENSRVLKILGRFPTYANKEISVPSSDGGEVFLFSAEGRHLKTYHALTGAQLLGFDYAASGLLSHITDAYGNVTEVQRSGNGLPLALVNPYGQTLALDSDPSGLLSQVTLPSEETHRFAYIGSGLMTRYTTPRNQDYIFTYDPEGRLLKDEDPAGGYQTVARQGTSNGGWNTQVTSALGRTNTYEMIFTPDLELIKRNTNPAGLTTETSILPDGQVATLSPDGTRSLVAMGPEPFLSFQGLRTDSGRIELPSGLYLSHSREESIQFADSTDFRRLLSWTKSTSINSRHFSSHYEKATGLWTEVSPEGRTTLTRIDSLGRVVERSIPDEEVLHNAYDNRGRLSSTTHGEGAASRTTRFSYDGSGYLSQIEDSEGRLFRFEYDRAGRVVKEILPDLREVAYSYDGNGNVLSLTPPGKPVHAFEYTPMDLEARYAPPPLGAGVFDTRNSYSLDKQLLDIQRPDGRQVHFAYDAGGRLEEITTPAGLFQFQYQAATGLLGSLSSPYGMTTSFSYDGRLPTQVTWSGAIAGTVTFGYDDNFRTSSQSINGANPVAFEYDQDGLLRQAGPLLLERSSQNGRYLGSTVGVVEETVAYSPFGELSQSTASVSGSAKLDFQYERDKLGRIVKKTESVDGLTRVFEYAYDLAGRLKEVKRNGTVLATYGYDANGNRLSKSMGAFTETGTYDAQDRLLQYGGATFAYGVHGELQSKTEGEQTTLYDYDDFGNLVGVELPDGNHIEYLIDGQNRRVGRKVNGVLVQGFLYRNQLNPVAELDGAGQVVAEFIYGSKRNVPDLMYKGGETYRILSDHLGSPQLVVNTVTGEVVQRIEYDEFGNVLEDSQQGFQPFGFAGGVDDRQVGLVRFGARDYNAAIGRWTTKDPIKFRNRESNLYAYVENDPVNFTDVSGKSKGGKQNLDTEGLNVHTDPKIIKERLEIAIKLKQAKRIKALRALLKVAKRGGTYCLIFGMALDITLEIMGSEAGGGDEGGDDLEGREMGDFPEEDVDFSPVI